MPTHNFPVQVTPFVGRTEELNQIAKSLLNPACQLLTLVGLGGIGKTRIAIEAACAQSDTFADGVYFVPVQALNSADFMVMAIAETLDFQPNAGEEPRDQLLNYLRHKNLLLVMDNLEHLLDDTTLISDILNGAPQTKILATSREALKLREEWVYEVDGLTFPARDSELEIENYGAVQLFVQNAQRVSSSFQLDQTNKPGVARICQLVNGMPLALELAAGWVRTLSCLEIAQEIERSLDILESPTRNIPARHRSMRAVLDYSWVLLSETEQAVFMKLSVFRDGFTRAAAEAVASASLPLLAALVDKSLLRHTPDGRYDIHELLRQYGDEQLIQSGSKAMTQDAHSAYYMEFLRQRELDIKGRRQLSALNEVEADYENIRTAWYWTVARKNYQALDSAAECWVNFCEMRGHIQEGWEFLRTAQEQLAGETTPELKRIWGRIQVRSLWMLPLVDLELVEMARVQTEAVLTIARQQGDKPQIAYCLWFLGALGHITKDSEAGIPFLEESFALFTELGDRFYMARAADWLGAVYGAVGQREKFIALSEQSLKWRRAIGDQFGITASLMNLMAASVDAGQYELAKQYAQEMEHIYREIGSRAWVVRSIAALSFITLVLGNFQEARTYAEAALEMASKTGVTAVSGTETALSTLSLLAVLEEDYGRSWDLAEQASFEVQPMSFPEEALAVAACGLENYSTAQFCFLNTLEQAVTSNDQRGMAMALPVATVLLAHQDCKIQAVELSGLAFHHHASPRAWLEQWPLMTRLRTQLEAELGAEIYWQAWERGKNSNLERVARNLLQRFQPDDSQQAVHASNSRLVEPLTERELEILQKISAGLSNAEIAAQLVIEVSTVKKHINRLYDKMGAKTRTHALVRAKELNLL
jgi:predicted ATPase/DNA-binding CsgD family transcriptional regulator